MGDFYCVARSGDPAVGGGGGGGGARVQLHVASEPYANHADTTTRSVSSGARLQQGTSLAPWLQLRAEAAERRPKRKYQIALSAVAYDYVSSLQIIILWRI